MPGRGESVGRRRTRLWGRATSIWLATTIGLIGAVPCAGQTNAAVDWNLIASNAIVASGQSSVVQTRSFAIVQVAVHDALNAVDRRYATWSDALPVVIGASPDAAVATAAHDALVGLFPAQRDALDAVYAAAMAGLPEGQAKQAGAALGKTAAATTLTRRESDGSANANRPYTPGEAPGDYLPTTPTSPVVTPGWGEVAPFALTDLAERRPPPPYRLNDDQYDRDVAEVQLIGAASSTVRSAERTQIARFWAEPQAPMWNRIARGAIQDAGLDLWKSARLLAVLTLAQADATISVWEAKYFYAFWRPITAIRRAHLDGNGDTAADPGWVSLLTASNHPEYPSAHSYQAAAAAEVLAETFGDAFAFSTTSATLADVTRTFDSFSEAAAECGDSRIYGGIHFRLAVETGLKRGAAIGRAVEGDALTPMPFRE
jgi:hypothetical protein